MIDPDVTRVTPSEVVTAFANTHTDGGGRVELLGDGESLATWLAELPWSTPALPDQTITDENARETRELRDALVTLLTQKSSVSSVTKDQVRRADAVLESASRKYPIDIRISHEGVRLLASEPGLPGLLGSVLAAAAQIALNGEWSRVKACGNDPCRLAFVDRTRNTSAVFCSPQCSSQHSMRAYRARRRAAQAQASSDDSTARQL